MKKYLYIVCFFVAMFASVENGLGQSCSATWNLNTSITPTIVGAVTAPTAGASAVGSGLATDGTLDANYGTWGVTTWPNTIATAAPATETHYIQFSVTPNCGTLSLTSINMNTFNNEASGTDRMDVFWSTNATFATSTAIVTAVSTTPGANNYTNGAIAASCTSGQTIYIRVYFHYANAGIYFGVKSMALSGTTGSCPINTFPWCESFDGATFAPTNWANTNISGTILWQRAVSGTGTPACTPHSGAGAAWFNSFSYNVPNEALLVTPALNTTGSYSVTFWMYGDPGYSGTAD